MKKNKKIIIAATIILCLSLFFNILFSNTSVTIDLIDNNQIYYVTLLSEKKENGPWILDSKYNEINQSEYASVWEKFVNYDDEYYFIGNVGQVSKKENYIWGYHCPKNFKVLMYSPIEDKFFESKKFNSLFAKNYLIAKVNDNELKLLTPFNGIPYDVFSLLIRFTSILIIEVVLAFIFKLKGKGNVTDILKANVVSYIFILFNLQMFQIKDISVYLVLIVCLKIISYMVKRLIYNKDIKDNKKYCLISNFIPLVIVELINLLLFCR